MDKSLVSVVFKEKYFSEHSYTPYSNANKLKLKNTVFIALLTSSACWD